MVCKCTARILANKASEGLLFPSITFPKFAASTPSIFASAVNPVLSRFAFSHATAAFSSSSRFLMPLPIRSAASAMRFRSSSATSWPAHTASIVRIAIRASRRSSRFPTDFMSSIMRA